MPHSWIGAMVAESCSFTMIYHFYFGDTHSVSFGKRVLRGRFFETVHVYSVITFDSLDGYRILLEAVFLLEL